MLRGVEAGGLAAAPGLGVAGALGRAASAAAVVAMLEEGAYPIAEEKYDCLTKEDIVTDRDQKAILEGNLTKTGCETAYGNSTYKVWCYHDSNSIVSLCRPRGTIGIFVSGGLPFVSLHEQIPIL